MAERRVHRLVPLIWVAVALVVGACGTPAAPSGPGAASGNLDETGILLVAVGERVQPRPPTEEFAQALSDAFEMGQSSDDLGYPWLDPATGELVLSVVNDKGRQAIAGFGFKVPYRIRVVAHSEHELEFIKDDVTFLHGKGVAGSEFLFGSGPDQRDNRVLLHLSQMSRPLLAYLAAHYPVDALAIQVDPSIAP